jgi:ribonuclease E
VLDSTDDNNIHNTAGTPEGTDPPKKAVRRRATKATGSAVVTDEAALTGSTADDDAAKPAKKAVAKKAPAKKAPAKKAPAKKAAADEDSESATPAKATRPTKAAPATGHTADDSAEAEEASTPRRRTRAPAVVVTFQPPTETAAPVRRATRPAAAAASDEPTEKTDEDEVDEEGIEGQAARRRRRGRRGRGRGPADLAFEDGDTEEEPTTDGTSDDSEDGEDDDEDGPEGAAGTRRRRRRRRSGTGGAGAAGEGDDDVPTVTRVREPQQQQRQRQPRNRDGGGAADEDGVRGISGSTRMAAKRVRRQEGRDSGRKRAPILTEAEFLTRREAVERTMVVRQKGDRTQIAVLEDGILVEHYVTKASATSYAGNVYLGKVQNVLPSMEAAFVDIGKGRNAVLYAGEVNWDGVSGGSRKIEQALKGGQDVLVQVSKDPIGHKGARLTSQISLPGRYLVYVPESSMTGISRKLPENERTRLKNILKNVVPEGAGVIIRTAAEGASEEEIAKDVSRLQAQWESIKAKAEKGNGPVALHTEPDLVIKVVRDIFNEDFASLVVQGTSEWETIREYVEFVAPELAPRLKKFAGDGDVFAEHRIDEQLLKALDRKVYLPSGGSLVIDRTEAMVVVDVNTGKYVGKGGNLEETVTRNNLEAAEEIARQLRLRDLGGIIVVDFIDMVLESNRDLVVRRLVECLGRDRTKHQVAEVTSLGLVQMTRKRVGQGLLESFSETCEACNGRGVKVHLDPVDPKPQRDRDRDPKVGPRAPKPGPAAEGDAPAEGTGGGSRNRRRRGGSRGTGTPGTPPENELAELMAADDLADAAPEADAAEQAADVVADPAAEPQLSAVPAEVPEADAAEQAVEVVLEPEAAPVPAEEPLVEAVEVAAEPVATEPAGPKKRRRAVSRPAGAPDA